MFAVFDDFDQYDEKKKRFYSSYLPLKCTLLGKCSSDQTIEAQECWQMTHSNKRRLPQLGWENFTSVPLFPNWHMAWPNFLPRDKRKGGHNMCSGKMGNAMKFSTFDRSVALLEHRHSLPLPVAISLDVSCYSYNLPIFILKPIAAGFWMSLRSVCKVWEASKTKSGGSSLTQIQCSAYHRYQEGGQVNLYAWEASATIFHLRPQGWMG